MDREKAIKKFNEIVKNHFFIMSSRIRDNYKDGREYGWGSEGYIVTADNKLYRYRIWDEPYDDKGYLVNDPQTVKSYVKLLKQLTDAEYLDFSEYVVKEFKGDNVEKINLDTPLEYSDEVFYAKIDGQRYEYYDDEWHGQDCYHFERKIKSYLKKKESVTLTESQAAFRKRAVGLIKAAINLVAHTDTAIKYEVEEKDGVVRVILLSATDGEDEWKINSEMGKFMRLNHIRHGVVAALNSIIEKCEDYDGRKYCVQIGDMGRQCDPMRTALKIATKAHEGQKDKAGEDYILHPIAVSRFCKTYLGGIAGLLHDVVEDTDITLEEIKASKIGGQFNDKIVFAVDCLTKREGESLDDYYKRVAKSDIALEVKFADMRHNSDVSRFPAGTEEEAQDNKGKYFERAQMLRVLIGDKKSKEVMTDETYAYFGFDKERRTDNEI